jgi:hypothetical protein
MYDMHTGAPHSLDPDRSASGGVGVGASDTQLQAFGMLHYHLCQLRSEMRRLFMQQAYPHWRWGMRLFAVSTLRRLQQYVVSFTHPSYTHTHTHTSLSSDCISPHHPAPSDAGYVRPRGPLASEYASMCADVDILLAPDFLHCGCQKLATAARMRVSYACFVPPVQ